MGEDRAKSQAMSVILFVQMVTGCSAVNFLSVSHAQHQHQQAVVFYLADQPVVAHAVSPQLPEARAAQWFSNASWILQLGHAFIQKLQDAAGVLGASLSSSRVAAAESSTLHAMALKDLLQWNRPFLAAADAFKRLLRQVHILDLLEMLKDSFARVKRLGPPGAAGQLLQSQLNGSWETDSQHGHLAIQV
jgi:hypothetical protein